MELDTLLPLFSRPLFWDLVACKAAQEEGMGSYQAAKSRLKPGPMLNCHTREPDIFAVDVPLDIMKEVSVFPVINWSLGNGAPYGEGRRGELSHCQ